MRIGYLGAALLVGLSASATAQATTLAQLRARLGAMQATAPLSAQVSVSDRRTSGDKDKPKVVQGKVVLHIEDGADGLGIRLPPALLTRAGKEAAASGRDADAPTPTRNALSSLDPLQLNGMADFAPVLLHKLEGAKLTGQHDASRAGEPVHVMTFDIPSLLNKDSRDAINHYQGQLTVWLNGDGTPVAVRVSRQYKGSKFFISFSFFNHNDYSLQRIGQRLVVRRYHSVNGGSGMGKHSTRTVDIELTPTAAAPATVHAG